MELSQKNLKIATDYFLGNTTEFDKKDKDYKNLFLSYASDCNSSSVREAVTLNFLGYEQYTSKHGADGFDPKTGRQKEVKPRYFREGQKASIGGNFNDMTLELLEKKQDLDIICSIFVGTRLVLVLEFPIDLINDQMKKTILNAKLGKRVVCKFSNTSFQDSTDMIIHHYDSKFINKNQCFSKKTSELFETKYAQQLSKQKTINKKSV